MHKSFAWWSAYYTATSDRPTHPLLLDALDRFDTPGFAIDLGCGGGIETLELLRRGWGVLAVDGEQAAIEQALGVVPSEDLNRLETAVVSFDEMELPSAELIWSGLSLSFTPPTQIDEVWAKIVSALKPGSRVACDIFGPHHAWSANADMTFLAAEQLRERLTGLDVESFVEREEEASTVFQGLQHWHAFDVIARKAY